MACDITKGRKRPCKDSRIGLKYVDFMPFGELAWGITAHEVPTLPAAISEVFRYDVKGAANNLVETGTVNTEQGTTEVKAAMNLALPKLTKESEVELQAMAYGRMIAFAWDYNGNCFVVGSDSGLDVTTFVKSTDISGYTVTMEAIDKATSPYLSSSAKTALTALVSTDLITL